MPEQEPPSDAKSEEVDAPPDDKDDTDGRKNPTRLHSPQKPAFQMSTQSERCCGEAVRRMTQAQVTTE